MRTLNKVIEFQQEASNALFTKAHDWALRSSCSNWSADSPENTPEEAAVLGKTR